MKTNETQNMNIEHAPERSTLAVRKIILKAELLDLMDALVVAPGDAGGGPLAHAVHGEDRGFGEGRGVEGRSRVGQVVAREQHRHFRVEGPPAILYCQN